MLGLFDYKEGFNLSLRVNFVRWRRKSEGLIFTGSEDHGDRRQLRQREPRAGEKAPGYTIGTFTEAMQKQIIATNKASIPRSLRASPWRAPRVHRSQGYSDSLRHFKNFFARCVPPARGGRCGLRLPRGGCGLAEQLSMDAAPLRLGS